MRPLKLSRNNVALRVDKFLLEYNHVAQLQILRARVLGAARRMGCARKNLLLAIIPQGQRARYREKFESRVSGLREISSDLSPLKSVSTRQ